MHVVVVGCGRVGSGVAVQLEAARATRSSVVDRSKRAFDRLPPDFAGTEVVGSGFDREALDAAGRAGAGALAVGDERRQLEHPVRAHRAGELRDRERGRPHLRPAPRRHLPAPRHPDGRDGHLDDDPGAALARPRRRHRRVARRDRARCCSSSGSCRTTGPGRHLAELEVPGRIRVASVVRNNEPRLDVADADRPGGRRRALHRPPRRARASSTTASAKVRLMRVVIAGGGSVGTAIAADLLRQRPHASRSSSRTPTTPTALRGRPARRRGRRVRRLRGRRRCSAPGCAPPRSSSRRPATTRTTSSSAGSSKQEFAVPRVISRVNNSKQRVDVQRVVGRRRQRVDAPAARPRSSKRPSTVGSVVRLMDLDRAGATLVEVTLDADAPAIEGDRTVADLALPADAQIVAIVRDEKVLVPRDDTRLSRGRPRHRARDARRRARDRAGLRRRVSDGPSTQT